MGARWVWKSGEGGLVVNLRIGRIAKLDFSSFCAIQRFLMSGLKLRISLNFFAYFLFLRKESMSPKAQEWLVCVRVRAKVRAGVEINPPPSFHLLKTNAI